MKNGTRMTCLGVGVSLFLSLLSPAIQAGQDEDLFRKAKILIFDKKWQEAQDVLEELLEDYPHSPWASQALFYLGKSLEEQEGKEKEAIDTFKEYLLHGDKSEILTQEAEIGVIKLAFSLYKKGRKNYLKEIETRLFRPDKVVRYYAAIKLSYLEDKRAARKAVPVLEKILEEEKDEELRDKAKIALLRIDPAAFKKAGEERRERNVMMLKVRVVNKWSGKATFSLNIPWSLADLALANIPEDARKELRDEGYDLDRIIRQLTEVGEIIRIETKESIIKIWID